jgi:response regulator RpfG family c-di-GMP phosphodiesterase
LIQSAIAPQELVVKAPLDLVMSVIASAEYSSLPGAGVNARRIDDPKGRVLVEFIASDFPGQDPIIKELASDPPDHVVYSHVTGPYTGTIEEIHLTPRKGGTRLTLTAHYLREGGTARLVRHVLEEGAREHLALLQHMAESQARRVGVAGVAEAMVPIPMMTSAEEVLAATAEQEEMEWGHAGHGRGVARIAVALAQEMRLPAQHVEDLRQAAILHDLGKVALDSNLWGSLRTLDREQRRQMEVHPRLGYHLAGRVRYSEAVRTTILYHHERWDGSGYPEHMVGHDIPLKARILGLAEHVDTMMRAGNRRDFMPTSRIIAVIQGGAGREWEPLLAHRVVRMLKGR